MNMQMPKVPKYCLICDQGATGPGCSVLHATFGDDDGEVVGLSTFVVHDYCRAPLSEDELHDRIIAEIRRAMKYSGMMDEAAHKLDTNQAYLN